MAFYLQRCHVINIIYNVINIFTTLSLYLQRYLTDRSTHVYVLLKLLKVITDLLSCHNICICMYNMVSSVKSYVNRHMLT